MRRATCFDEGREARDEFQSTLSMRRATFTSSINTNGQTVFQSTLSMRRATMTWAQIDDVAVISIHALHEESDFGSA